MKKILFLTIIFTLIAGGVFAQVNYDDMETAFSQFSDDVAQSLPYVSTIGLNWSDATVRKFPHFGVGLSAGFVFIPKEAFTDLADSMNIALPSELTDSELGVPLPAYSVDGRIGGLVLPFDIGIKLGVLPPDLLSGSEYSVDYTLAGIDFRFPVLKQNLVMPSVALSVGYNYLNAGVQTAISGAGLGSGIDISSITGGSDTLDFTDPEVRFQMQSNVIDAKLHVSKKLLIFTPYAGAGYSYGWSKAGGGVSGDVLLNGSPITSSEIDTLTSAFEAAGYDTPDLTSDGFFVESASDGGSLRAFGGMSINILLLKLDLNAMYSFTTQKLGASLNARISF